MHAQLKETTGEVLLKNSHEHTFPLASFEWTLSANVTKSSEHNIEERRQTNNAAHNKNKINLKGKRCVK